MPEALLFALDTRALLNSTASIAGFTAPPMRDVKALRSSLAALPNVIDAL
jgi:hypothetical protein